MRILKSLRILDRINKMDKIILKNAKKILPVPHSLYFFLLCAYACQAVALSNVEGAKAGAFITLCLSSYMFS